MYSINGYNYTPPSLPILLQIARGVSDPSKLFPPGSVYEITRDSVVQLELNVAASADIPGVPHPFHLHGVRRFNLDSQKRTYSILGSQHTFSVISAGGSPVNTATSLRRDTVSLGSGPKDGAIIRFKVCTLRESIFRPLTYYAVGRQSRALVPSLPHRRSFEARHGYCPGGGHQNSGELQATHW